MYIYVCCVKLYLLSILQVDHFSKYKLVTDDDDESDSGNNPNGGNSKSDTSQVGGVIVMVN